MSSQIKHKPQRYSLDNGRVVIKRTSVGWAVSFKNTPRTPRDTPVSRNEVDRFLRSQHAQTLKPR